MRGQECVKTASVLMRTVSGLGGYLGSRKAPLKARCKVYFNHSHLLGCQQKRWRTDFTWVVVQPREQNRNQGGQEPADPKENEELLEWGGKE